MDFAEAAKFYPLKHATRAISILREFDLKEKELGTNQTEENESLGLRRQAIITPNTHEFLENQWEGPDFKGIVDVIFQHAYTYDKGKATEIELDPVLKKRTQELYDAIAEVVAETDDVLIEKFFAGEHFTREELSSKIGRASCRERV